MYILTQSSNRFLKQYIAAEDFCRGFSWWWFVLVFCFVGFFGDGRGLAVFWFWVLFGFLFVSLLFCCYCWVFFLFHLKYYCHCSTQTIQITLNTWDDNVAVISFTERGKAKETEFKNGVYSVFCTLSNLWNCYEKILKRQEVRCYLPDGNAHKNIWKCSALTYNNLEMDKLSKTIWAENNMSSVRQHKCSRKRKETEGLRSTENNYDREVYKAWK